jgi:hypothetical protein
MAMTILEQEVEHEEDLPALMEDLELMVSRGCDNQCGRTHGQGARSNFIWGKFTSMWRFLRGYAPSCFWHRRGLFSILKIGAKDFKLS